MAGSIGIAPSANINPERRHPSMFEPVHGSAPKYAGTGRANPVGAILSSALMLETLGHRAAALEIEGIVAGAIRAGNTTHDLGGSMTTSEVGDLVARAVAGAGSAAVVS